MTCSRILQLRGGSVKLALSEVALRQACQLAAGAFLMLVSRRSFAIQVQSIGILFFNTRAPLIVL